MNICQYINCKKTAKIKYCSLSCGAKQQAINHAPSKKLEHRICNRKECANNFDVTSRNMEKIYCSRSCAAIVTNKNRNLEIDKKLCLLCKSTLTDPRYIYCSQTCMGSYVRKKKIDSWLNGDWNGNCNTGLATPIKRYLIEQAGYRCASPNCAVPGGFKSINPVTNKCPLQIDHIDGDAYNNKPENLIVLCPNCHSLTTTYGALNKNGTRKYRHKYYPGNRNKL